MLTTRDFLAQLPAAEHDAFVDHVTLGLLSTQLAAQCLTLPRAHIDTIAQLAGYLAGAIAALEAAQAVLPTPDGGY